MESDTDEYIWQDPIANSTLVDSSTDKEDLKNMSRIKKAVLEMLASDLNPEAGTSVRKAGSETDRSVKKVYKKKGKKSIKKKEETADKMEDDWKTDDDYDIDIDDESGTLTEDSYKEQEPLEKSFERIIKKIDSAEKKKKKKVGKKVSLEKSVDATLKNIDIEADSIDTEKGKEITVKYTEADVESIIGVNNKDNVDKFVDSDVESVIAAKIGCSNRIIENSDSEMDIAEDIAVGKEKENKLTVDDIVAKCIKGKGLVSVIEETRIVVEKDSSTDERLHVTLYNNLHRVAAQISNKILSINRNIKAVNAEIDKKKYIHKNMDRVMKMTEDLTVETEEDAGNLRQAIDCLYRDYERVKNNNKIKESLMNESLEMQQKTLDRSGEGRKVRNKRKREVTPKNFSSAESTDSESQITRRKNKKKKEKSLEMEKQTGNNKDGSTEEESEQQLATAGSMYARAASGKLPGKLHSKQTSEEAWKEVRSKRRAPRKKAEEEDGDSNSEGDKIMIGFQCDA